MDYTELCREAVESVRKSGATEAEALVLGTHSVGVEIKELKSKPAATLKMWA